MGALEKWDVKRLLASINTKEPDSLSGFRDNPDSICKMFLCYSSLGLSGNRRPHTRQQRPIFVYMLSSEPGMLEHQSWDEHAQIDFAPLAGMIL
jgi:hypothetical protein